MKLKNLYYALLLIAFSTSLARAQKGKDYRILLKSGSFTPNKNISANAGKKTNLRTSAGKSFVIIQFEEIPTQEERERLRQEGIELLEYIPNYAYTATIKGQANARTLAGIKGRAIIELSPAQKVQSGLLNGRIPGHAIKNPGKVNVWISYPRTFKFEEIKEALKEKGFQIVSETFKAHQIVEVELPVSRITALAELPFVQYVQAIPPPDKPFNHKSLANSRANILQSALPGGRNLRGEGVVLGIGDDANPLQHIDFNNRIINRTAIELGAHGVHVMGTMAGGGIMNERYAGHAPKATIVTQSFSGLLAYSPQYVQDYNMVVTNNSYGGDVNTCETFGVYDLYSYILDQQAFQMPHLQHVFAAGNSGTSNCSPYPNGFGNVLSGYQTAKNVISVGNTNDQAVIASGSSKGPVVDGRIKPEITAQGTAIMSTIPVNLYGSGSGTSMASPAVAGGLALLYQRYRQLFNGADPKNALMKALVCNGATDKGNEGPDYRYGFGWLNLNRSVLMLESQSYRNDSLAHQETKSFNISVPAGTAQLKVMLYWNDPAANVLSTQNLVHNLDLSVKNGGQTTLPRLLDPTPSKVNTVAGSGVDNINNMEQVVISNPGQGEYTIEVKGTAIAQNPRQEYFVVYDVIPNSVTLTYPAGGERLRDGDVFFVSWDAFGNAASTYTVQYSLNGGNNWTTIGNNLAAATRQLSWTIPAGTTSDNARVKVIQNSTGATSVSEPFTIVGVPTVTLSSLQCEGYIALEWSAVTGATDYEVMVLKGDEMVPVATTQATKYLFSGMDRDSTYLVSVRARLNGKAGRRAVAISRKPDSGTCQGNISDNDLKIEAIITPASSGRKNTGTELSNAVFIKIRIKNLDDTDSNAPLTVGFDMNGTPVPLETITPYIEKGKTYDHTFSYGADMSNPGEYKVKVYIHSAKDLVAANDTISKTFRQLANEAIVLPFFDDMEYLPVQTVVKNQVGLTGDGRYDFSSNTDAGRIRTFINSGFAFSGQKALTLDVNRYYSAGNTSYLDGTFNLGEYDIEHDDLRLNFSYKNHGQKSNANNKVWIRGSDSDPWILAYDLYTNQNLPQDGYKTTPGIELSSLLSAAGKNFSSSFQVRFGQWGKMIAADPSSGGGYSFDNIEIYFVIDDIQMAGITAPSTESCGLSNQETITVKIRNSSARDILNIPVSYSTGSGEVVTETIAQISRRSTADFTFATKADLSTFGPRNIKVWTSLDSDSYRENDTITISLYNAPVISSFPYLENFENGDGYWYSRGVNSSWQHGTPVSAVVNTAASGTKIWKTNLSGGHNDREESYLYSPCFNLNGLSSPMLSFAVSLDLEVCDPNPCDYTYIEYSGDGGAWTRLGAQGQGTNWYNKTYSGKGAWSAQDMIRWRVSSILLPTGFSNLKLRFVLVSDGFTRREGIAIDDIHIFNRNGGIYDESTMNAPVTQSVNGGSSWIDFMQNGKLVASILPNGQNLGNTAVQAYINTSGVRNANKQYYLNRNVTIKPATLNLPDSATVRFYFLDSEIESLVNASSCATCGKPANAYALTISKYKSADLSKEDGDLVNSVSGNWAFYPSAKVKIVPYDRGYYAEIKVRSFSEFWLASDYIGTGDALPVTLVNFRARKTEGDGEMNALLEWETTSEENFAHFDVETADGDENYRKNAFVKISEIRGKGNSNEASRYSFTDSRPGKAGIIYYRLRVVDADSTFTYSTVKSVNFDQKAIWTVYPNPSKGIYQAVFQAEAGAPVRVRVTDVSGRVFQESELSATGSVQKSQVDLSAASFTQGLYIFEIKTGAEKQIFKVLKE